MTDGWEDSFGQEGGLVGWGGGGQRWSEIERDGEGRRWKRDLRRMKKSWMVYERSRSMSALKEGGRGEPSVTGGLELGRVGGVCSE